jgi:hypothetical protein
MIRSIASGVLALGIAVAPNAATAAHHEPVIQVVTVEVMPGKLEAYRAAVKKLTAVIARIDANAKVRMWEATAAGEDTGQILVGVEYPNEAAWAADTAKTQADPEWNAILASLTGLRTVVGTSIWRDVSPNPATDAATGGVLLLTGVQVQAGKLEEYRTRVGAGRAITERLGSKSQLRMWRAELAGTNTGAVAVGIEYPDLATYVADQAKLNGDAEWKKLLAGLDAVRTLQSRSLYREITP